MATIDITLQGKTRTIEIVNTFVRDDGTSMASTGTCFIAVSRSGKKLHRTNTRLESVELPRLPMWNKRGWYKFGSRLGTIVKDSEGNFWAAFPNVVILNKQMTIVSFEEGAWKHNSEHSGGKY